MNGIIALEQRAFETAATNEFLDSLDRDRMQKLFYEIDAEFYWQRRNPSWKTSTSNKLTAWYKKIQRNVKKRLKTGRVKPCLTLHGSTKEHVSLGLLDGPYDYETRCLSNPNWQCLWMDAYCAGWINEELLQIHTYTEGDVTRIYSPNREILLNELEDYAHWAKDEGFNIPSTVTLS